MKTALLTLALTACISPVPTLPKVAEDATYELHTPSGQCTAWAVDDHHLVTAGHCCDDEGSYFAAQPGRSLLPAEVVMGLDVDYEAQAPVDICLLKTEAFLPASLVLADKMPLPGDPVGFVGYPNGKWTHNKGVYVGDIDGPFQFWNDYVATAPCGPGASGSAMYSEDGVYGVLVRMVFVGDRVYPGDIGCVASPLYQIEAILTLR
jgi:hypothetical protein